MSCNLPNYLAEALYSSLTLFFLTNCPLWNLCGSCYFLTSVSSCTTVFYLEIWAKTETRLSIVVFITQLHTLHVFLHTDSMFRVRKNLYICVGSAKHLWIKINTKLFTGNARLLSIGLGNLLSNACKNNSWSACKWSILEFLLASLSLSRFLGGIFRFLSKLLVKPPSSSVRWLDSVRLWGSHPKENCSSPMVIPKNGKLTLNKLVTEIPKNYTFFYFKSVQLAVKLYF